MTQDEFEPKTEPSGALDPPSRKPPTAVGAAGSDPEFRRPRSIVTAVAEPNWLGRFIKNAFDALDEAAEKVAESLNIRPPRRGA